MKKLIVLALCLVMAAAGVFAGGQQSASGGIHIEMVSKGFQHQFWQYVEQGAKKAGSELGVTVNFVGPESETMKDKQDDMFRTALGKKPAAICFAALDAKSQAPLVAQAKAQGIPVVTFDATVDSNDPVSFVATDSNAAGAVAADKMFEATGGKGGKLAVICHDPTNTTGIDRRDGFVNQFKNKYTNYTIVDIQYGDGDPMKSADICKAVMTANPDLVGYYATNEGSAIGLVTALKEMRQQGRARNVVGIGFDSGKTQMDAVRDGTLYGAVQQNPVKIGYDAVQMAYKAIKGESVPKRVDTGIVWSDTKNVDSAEVKAVIYE
jgi:ribose transport system substrate-binding protein